MNQKNNSWKLAIVGFFIVLVIYFGGCIGGCGNLNQNCCKYDKCNSLDLVCSDEGKCLKCGGINKLCCGKNICDEGGVCHLEKCKKCGGVRELCCKNNKCDEGAVCYGGEQCEKCGSPGELCCENNTCNGGICLLSHVHPSCEKCGGSGEMCCENEKCNEGICVKNKCKDIVETYCSLNCLTCLTKKNYSNCYKEKYEMYEGIKKGGVTYCNTIDEKIPCVSIFGMYKKNISLCEEILNGSLKSYCINGVAVAKQDVFLCDVKKNGMKNLTINNTIIMDLDFGCMEDIAAIKKDIYFCEKINDYKYIVGNTSVSFYTKYGIILKREYANGVLHTLSKYSAPYGTALNASCIAHVAIVNQDIFLCNMIPTTYKYSQNFKMIETTKGKDECITRIALSTEDMSLCEKTSSFDCIIKFAIVSQDISLCEKTLYLNKEICIASVAVAQQDISICEKISNTEGKDWCIREVAIAKKDTSLCNEISIVVEKDKCIRTVAASKQDVSLCEKASSTATKDWCVREVAIAKKDISLCNKISTTEGKDYCIKMAK